MGIEILTDEYAKKIDHSIYERIMKGTEYDLLVMQKDYLPPGRVPVEQRKAVGEQRRRQIASQYRELGIKIKAANDLTGTALITVNKENLMALLQYDKVERLKPPTMVVIEKSKK